MSRYLVIRLFLKTKSKHHSTFTGITQCAVSSVPVVKTHLTSNLLLLDCSVEAGSILICFYGLFILLQNQLKFSTRFWSVYIEAFTQGTRPLLAQLSSISCSFREFWLNIKLAPCPPSGKSWIRHSCLCSLMKVFLQCLYNFTMSPHCNVGYKCNQELAAVQPEWTTKDGPNGISVALSPTNPSPANAFAKRAITNASFRAKKLPG